MADPATMQQPRLDDVRLAPDLFGVGLHHIAFDGWSQKIFVRDLSRAYTARLEGATPQWERPALTLAQMHAEYAALRAVADTEQQRAYWHEQLRGLPRQSRRQVDLQVALAPAGC